MADKTSAVECQGARTDKADVKDKDKDAVTSVELAYVWMEKAQEGSAQWSNDCTRRQLNLWHLRKLLQPLKHIIFAFYLGWAFVEEPSWCISKRDACQMSEGWRLKLNNMPHSQKYSVPFQLTGFVKVLLLISIASRIYLLKLSRGSTFVWTRWRIFQVSIVSLALLDSIFVFFIESGIVPGTFMLNRFLRPFIFVASYKPLRQSATYVICAVPYFVSLLICLAGAVVMFSWIGLILYQGTPEGNAHFFSFSSALSNMYILFTTANSPDAFIPAYHESAWNFTFFSSYLVITLYLVKGLVTAAVYQGYKSHLRDGLREFYRNRRTGISEAFTLLARISPDGSKTISEETWIDFFVYYCNSRNGQPVWPFPGPDDDHLDMERAKVVFDEAMLENAGNTDAKGLSLQSFACMTEMLHDEKFTVPHETVFRDGSCAHYLNPIRHFILEGISANGKVTICWDTIVDLLIFLDFILTVFTTLALIEGVEAGTTMTNVTVGNQTLSSERLSLWRTSSVWNTAASFLTVIYFVETNVKLAVLGSKRFFSYSRFSGYDLVNVYLLFGIEVVFWFISESEESVRRYMVAHIARYVRLIAYCKPFQDLAILLKKFLPTYERLGCLLGTTFYVYAEIGVQAFGGLIYSESLLAGTDYADNRYWDLNFNDCPTSLALLFVLLVVNNWFIFAEAYWILTKTWISQVYFVSFFIVTNLIVSNILVAIIIECFQTLGGELLETDQEEHEPRQKLMGRESVLREVMIGGTEAERLKTARWTIFADGSTVAPRKVSRQMHGTSSGSVNGSPQCSIELRRW